MPLLKLTLYNFIYWAFAAAIAMEADKDDSSLTTQQAQISCEEVEYFVEEEDNGLLSGFDTTEDLTPSSTYKHEKPPLTSADFDEGWRWRKDLILKYDNFTHDFNQVHQEMALKESFISAQLNGDANKANIAIAQFHFIVENQEGIKVIAVPLYVNEGRDSPAEIIFRSGRLAKDKPLFKPATEIEIHKKYHIHPPLEPKILDTELPFESNISKIELIESAVASGEVEKAKKLLKSMRVSLEERLSKKQKNDEHMERLQFEIKERFHINDNTPIRGSILGSQVYERIKKTPWQDLKRMEELYLHSEQNMLLYFKDNIVKIIESNFKEVRDAILPTFETLKAAGLAPEQPKIGKIHGIILNLHSRLDICERCAPSITRECERTDSFVAALKEWVPDYLKKENDKLKGLGLGEKEYDPEVPFFAVFSSVRQELSKQERRFKCGYDQKYEDPIDIKKLSPYFVTKITTPFKLDETDYLKEVG